MAEYVGLLWNNCGRFGTSLEQNPRSDVRISGVSRYRGNRIIKDFGAGDGNRTHVRGLGSRYSTIEPRPLRLTG